MIALIASLLIAPDDSFEGAKKLELLTSRQPASVAKKPIGDLVMQFGLALRETPYVGWTLERDMNSETCYVSLDRLDCVTFFESALGIARAFKLGGGKVTPQSVLQQVTLTRYWGGGPIKSYTDRIHYTSDWIFDNTRKGVVKDVCAGNPLATRFNVPLDFMSKHPSTYPKIKAHPELLQGIKKTEAESNKRVKWYFPAANLAEAAKELKTGDIIGITCTTPGMDCAHTGIIVVTPDGPHFMHASSVEKKVVFDRLITDVIANNPKYTGIMVARPLEPR